MNRAIVSKADENFYPGLKGLIGSVKKLYKDEHIIIFDYGLSEKSINELKSVDVEVISPIKSYSARPETLIETHYNDSIFALMSFSNLKYDTIIHLDADVIVCEKFDEIYEKLLNSDFVGVADHPPLTMSDTIGTDRDRKYVCTEMEFEYSQLSNFAYCAGIFGINMNAYKKIHPLMKKLYISDLALPFRDQTMLNIAIKLAKLETSTILPIQYNFRPNFRRDQTIKWSEDVTVNNDSYIYDDNPIKFIHYIGPNKPWQKDFNKSHTSYLAWEQAVEYYDSIIKDKS